MSSLPAFCLWFSTRRVWLPNVQWKRLYSDALGKFVRVKVTTHVLRCIDKAGGLDNYLLRTKAEDLDSELGEVLRLEVASAKKAAADARSAAGATAAAAARTPTPVLAPVVPVEPVLA